MLENKKRVFWEALLLTILVFMLGLLAGVLFEDKRVEIIEEYYIQSENSLMDLFAVNNLDAGSINCSALINADIGFAEKIYSEAKILEEYEKAGRLGDKLNAQHKKYDLMRVFLWMNAAKTKEACEDVPHLVVYIYNFNTDSLTEKATNSVWSKILEELKSEHGNEIILIPIAADNKITSLNLILEEYEISEYPVLIIDNTEVIRELSSAEEIEAFLD